MAGAVRLPGREVAAASGGSPAPPVGLCCQDVGARGEFLLPAPLPWAGAVLRLPFPQACWGVEGGDLHSRLAALARVRWSPGGVSFSALQVSSLLSPAWPVPC